MYYIVTNISSSITNISVQLIHDEHLLFYFRWQKPVHKYKRHTDREKRQLTMKNTSEKKERRRRNYVPSAALSKRERLRRNSKNNETLRHHRQRKREYKDAAQNNNQNVENMDTSGYDSPGAHMDNSQTRLVIQIPFRASGPRKRISRVLWKKNWVLSKIKTDFQELQRKYKTTLRRLQRLKKKELTKEPNTPRSKRLMPN